MMYILAIKFFKILKCKVNMETLEPTDDLTDECINFLKTVGSNSRKVSDIVNNQSHPIYAVIDKGIFKSSFFFF